MYICLDCEELFETPHKYKEDYGELNNCCPVCGGSYIETFRCDCCGAWIDGFEYYEVGKNKYCCDCCIRLNLE